MPKLLTSSTPVGAFISDSKTTATTRIATTIPPGVKEIIVNCTGAWRCQLAPPVLFCAKTTDNEATFTDYTSEATDRSTSTSVDLSSLNTAANGDYFYVGCQYPFGGVWIDVDGTNSNASSTMTGYYWAGSWTNVAITDGCLSTTTALANDGAVTWSRPTNWQSMFLRDLFPYADLGNINEKAKSVRLYVMRFQFAAALDSSTTLDEVCSLLDATEFPAGYMAVTTDYTIPINREKTGCLEYYDAAGTKTLTIDYIKEEIYD